jgi:hypothetical protein
MARPLSRLLSRRMYQQWTPFQKTPGSVSRALRAPIQKPAGRRTYSTGPNPRPRKSPIKIWPFIAITLAGSGAYILMVRSRAGTSQSTVTIQDVYLEMPSQAHFESRFNDQEFQAELQPHLHFMMSSSKL